MGSIPSDISRFAAGNPNILQTFLHQTFHFSVKERKRAKLPLDRANDVRLINERGECCTVGLLGGQSQREFVDIPSKIGGVARTDVLPWKTQLWREVELCWVSHTR